MTLDLDELERLAMAAIKRSAGPWWVERINSIAPWTDALSIACEPGCHIAHTTRGWEGDGSEGNSSAQALAAHIAACSPQTILSLIEGLEESVKLQSHYAELLNMHDGGERLLFANADAWLKRLAELREARKEKET